MTENTGLYNEIGQSKTSEPKRTRPQRVWFAALGLLSLLALSAGWIYWSVSRTSHGGYQGSLADMDQSEFMAESGAQVVQVALTAAGGMIDLRYQVVDPNKAVDIHDKENPPAVVDEATGEIYNTPWMGHLHNGELRAGVTYYTLLINSGGAIRRGSEVTVVLGGVRLENVPVQGGNDP